MFSSDKGLAKPEHTILLLTVLVITASAFLPKQYGVPTRSLLLLVSRVSWQNNFQGDVGFDLTELNHDRIYFLGILGTRPSIQM